MNIRKFLLASVAVCVKSLNMASMRTLKRSLSTYSSQSSLISSILASSATTQTRFRSLLGLRMSSSSSGDIQNPMNPNLYTEKGCDIIASLRNSSFI